MHFLPFVLVKAVPMSSAPRVLGNQITLSHGRLGHAGAVHHFPGVSKEGKSKPSESQGPNKALPAV